MPIFLFLLLVATSSPSRRDGGFGSGFGSGGGGAAFNLIVVSNNIRSLIRKLLPLVQYKTIKSALETIPISDPSKDKR